MTAPAGRQPGIDALTHTAADELAHSPVILLVDDDLDFLDTIEACLAGVGTLLKAATTQAAIELLQRRPVDVIVSDYRLRQGDGHQIARACQLLRPRPPVVLVTGYADKDLAIRSIDLQIFALLEKPLDLDRLTDTVQRAIAESRSRRSSQALTLDPVTREARYGQHHVRLTQTEYRILELLLERRGHRVSREELVTAIWGAHPVSRNVFDTHFCNLKRKLPFLKERLRVMRGEGYVLRD
jgi:DNA-binding response OmpR family regulator